ncbi:MAG: UvrD-helicase domain-containing protein [Peptoclostridium sp.]|uniref:ATP-dependent helicase n=1 Tax=Peptoclostridium sp. TaxID=1904860 RepID=UPI00139B0684|nr:ATP-dependent helicase [Peptoclostridium sp.]MZQ75400.1 UvrD-helicase domain-containing protein [Peptoclostridium sp.]
MKTTMLDENQKRAAEHFEGACIVVAGPGSGKTRVIASRIVRLIEKNVEPEKIVAISFTRASALEMKNRCITMCQQSSRVNFGTFHSVFFKILRSFRGFTHESIIDEDEKRRALRRIMATHSIENAQDDELLESLITEMSYMKNDLLEIKEYKPLNMAAADFKRVSTSYENYKTSMGKIDFDDMLVLTYKLLLENPDALETIKSRFRYILIDEFQDINRVQLEVLKLIAGREGNIFAVGDDDQSIYSFRGARPEFMYEFESFFAKPEKIILDINYRSCKEIIETSNRLIMHNAARNDKCMKNSRTESGRIHVETPKDSLEEAQLISQDILTTIKANSMKYGDFAVIYRTNTQSRALVDVFMDYNIPFSIADRVVSVYDHWAARDVISYLKIACGVGKIEDYARIVNRPFRYISREAVSIAKGSDDFTAALKGNLNLNLLQKKAIETLERDIVMISRLKPSDAVSYIRTSVEYDRHIIGYCNDKGIKSEGIFEVLDEVEESGGSFCTVGEFVRHIDRVKEELALQKTRKKNSSDCVTFTTMHGAKGLEFKRVYVIGAVEGILPHEKGLDSGILEEERRLFYVALTRAKDSVLISAPKVKYGKPSQESRFLEELLEYSEAGAMTGEYIYHKKFKLGKVLGSDNGIMRVKFKEGIKMLDYMLCLKNRIITAWNREGQDNGQKK